LKQAAEIISTALVDAVSDLGDETAPFTETRCAAVPAARHGDRLDKAVLDVAPEFSRSYLQQLIEEGLVSLNGAVTTKSASKVKAADQLRIELRQTPQSQAFKPEPMALQVVYEDADVLVINKPAGLVVHPAPGHWSGTLLNGLLAYHQDFSTVPRAGIVHRLDKDTSGLMVVARNRQSMEALVQGIAQRVVARQYLALAHGSWRGPSQVSSDAPIGRDPRNRLRMAVVDLAQHAGKAAKTDFVLLGQAQGHCLLRCILHTGRTHQIRVHLSALGHPLVADATYGGAEGCGLERQALHAVQLGFAHPRTGEPLVFEAEPPQDLRDALGRLGLRYNSAAAGAALALSASAP
jgi:23S rRNA pseudouridine1911/1915/1917 synthase